MKKEFTPRAAQTKTFGQKPSRKFSGNGGGNPRNNYDGKPNRTSNRDFAKKDFVKKDFSKKPASFGNLPKDSSIEGATDLALENPEHIVCGKNPVIEALKSGRTLNKVMIAAGQEPSFTKQVRDLCKENKIPCQEVQRNRLDAIAENHRGIVAYASPYAYVEIEEILEIAKSRNEDPLVVVLAEVEDPHNFGAVMRTAECVGAHGIIIAKHGAVPITETVVKVAAGAAEYIPVARVANISSALDELKANGVWVAGAQMTDAKPLWETDLTGSLALVMGSEGKGIPRLVAAKCDFMVQIPMHGKISSLNVSASAAVLLYEILRQRQNKK